MNIWRCLHSKNGLSGFKITFERKIQIMVYRRILTICILSCVINWTWKVINDYQWLLHCKKKSLFLYFVLLILCVRESILRTKIHTLKLLEISEHWFWISVTHWCRDRNIQNSLSINLSLFSFCDRLRPITCVSLWGMRQILLFALALDLRLALLWLLCGDSFNLTNLSSLHLVVYKAVTRDLQW